MQGLQGFWQGWWCPFWQSAVKHAFETEDRLLLLAVDFHRSFHKDVNLPKAICVRWRAASEDNR